MQKGNGIQKGEDSMTEYRAKKLKAIIKKTQGLIDELELLLDAELRHLNEYDACEDLCMHLSEADKKMRLAVYELQGAEAEAELEDMQDNMQQSMDQIAG